MRTIGIGEEVGNLGGTSWVAFGKVAGMGTDWSLGSRDDASDDGDLSVVSLPNLTTLLHAIFRDVSTYPASPAAFPSLSLTSLHGLSTSTRSLLSSTQAWLLFLCVSYLLPPPWLS